MAGSRVELQPMASAFNPKIRLDRPTTLMQGHDCCDFQYTWEV